jgi:hypothetical protein
LYGLKLGQCNEPGAIAAEAAGTNANTAPTANPASSTNPFLLPIIVVPPPLAGRLTPSPQKAAWDRDDAPNPA